MSVIVDFLRLLSSWIDLGLYSLAGFIYKVFCAVAESQIIKTEDVATFAERMYVVVGVFMLFKVGISMLKYLVNPDQLTDSKVGYGKLINNIAWALVILVSVPTIYKFAMNIQSAVIKSNVIPKVIFGKTAGANADMVDAGDQMIFTTLSAFVMPNYLVTDKEGNYVALESESVQNCFNTDSNGGNKGITDYEGLFTMNDGAVTGLTSSCETAFGELTDDESVNMYLSATENANIQQLLDVTVDAKLNDDIQEAAGRGGSFATKLYFLKYMWGISWLVGAFLCFIFTTFCIDMGIRSIKLTFLIMIAPIPVLSMINPDKGAKGMLGEWWKVTLATYLDVFLRIASVFFIIFIIQQVDLTTAIASEYGPIVSAFAMIFIIIGALLFAKQLPDLVSKLIPGMDSIVKGGFNPLKKLGDAANVASRAPIVGKGITGLSNRFATQNALNRANKRMENAKRRDKDKDFRNKLNQIKNSQNKTAEQKKQEMDELKEQHKQEMAAFDRESKEHLKAQRELNAEEAKFAGRQAAAGVGVFGGESKPITAAGAAVAKINKESAEKVHKMQMGSLQQRQAEANLAKVQDQAELERNAEIKQKEKQIVDVQREAEIQKRMKDAKYKDMTQEEARAAATRDVQDMEHAALKAQAVEKRVQAKVAQGIAESDARAQATQEVASMSQADIASEGNVSKVYSDAVGAAAKKQALSEGKSQEQAEKIAVEAAKSSRTSAEERVVGSLGDKMDEVAERQGVIYNSSEYAEQVKITREAKNRRNAIQSQYEKAAKQQQIEGKVTREDGVTVEGQEAIDYLDGLRVSYTKAASDYDFMSKELDGLSDKYPDDAATRKGYENAKDYHDKKSKVTKYASKSSKVSDNDKEGGQYTVEELIQEDTVVNRLRRADTALAGTREQIVTRQTELQAQGEILQSQIADNQAAGNTAEVTRLQNQLNVNNVELGRVQTSLRAADIARSNAVTGLVNEKATINSTLQQLEGEYQQVLDQTAQMTNNGIVDSQLSEQIAAKKQELESKINVLTNRTASIDDELRGLGTDPTTISTNSQPNVIIDTRIEGVGSFDRIGSPIRTKVENIVNQMEADVQRMTDVTLSVEERTKAKLAVESSYREYEEAVKAAGESIYSGMSSDTQRQVYDKKINDRIRKILDKKNNS